MTDAQPARIKFVMKPGAGPPASSPRRVCESIARAVGRRRGHRRGRAVAPPRAIGTAASPPGWVRIARRATSGIAAN
jgi:hypothetical protein